MEHFIRKIVGVKYVVHYVDDFLFVIKEREEAERARDQTLALGARIGLPWSADKTEGPTTKLTFLGIQLDTIKMEASLDAGKLHDLRELLKVWEKKTAATIEELQSLTGTLNWVTRVIRPGRSYIRRIITFHTEKSRISAGPHTLSADVKADIEWWRNFAPQWNGVSMLYQVEWMNDAHKIELTTDACEAGYGAMWNNAWIAGTWNEEQIQLSRNYARGKMTRSMPFLELLALVLAAATWGKYWKTRKVIFWTDCQPVHFAVENMQSPQPRIMGLIRALSHIAAKCGFDFKAKWLSGLTNVAADVLSRNDLVSFRAQFPKADEIQTKTGTLPPFHQL